MFRKNRKFHPNASDFEKKLFLPTFQELQKQEFVVQYSHIAYCLEIVHTFRLEQNKIVYKLLNCL